jgi:aminoglycoside phosphotransferase (APT) family kinase protein
MRPPSPIPSQDRTGIYYWKCDRAAAFHGTEALRPENPQLDGQLRDALRRRFPETSFALTPAEGQGNHRTFRLKGEALDAFVRTEDGPERDNYFDVEAVVADALLARGVPVPKVLACDCSRADTSFAWQVLEYVPYPDLNQHFKRGALEIGPVAEAIGSAVAAWQDVPVSGYGPFSATEARTTGRLVGLQPSYSHYLFLNLDKHLTFLTERGFFSPQQAVAVLEAISGRQELIGLGQGCLVHKDLALWNILGSPDRAAAFIDWDDAISGDPMDDLSLLACFHGRSVLERALAGYARVRPLPDNHLPRFWLCLLRNMLVKAVIRVGAGYFKRNDSFFLIGAGATGADLEAHTRQRIDAALLGLTQNGDLSILH